MRKRDNFFLSSRRIESSGNENENKMGSKHSRSPAGVASLICAATEPTGKGERRRHPDGSYCRQTAATRSLLFSFLLP